MLNKSSFPQSTIDFINCVTNPFSCAVPGRIVDNDPQMSLPWKDYSINNGLSVVVNGTTTASQGLAIFLLLGSNRWVENSIISSAGYQLIAVPLTAGGVAVGATATALLAVAQANYSTLGNYALYYRFVAAAIRAKCLIEEVTTSTTVAISRMYSGLMKPSDGYNAYGTSGNYFSLAQQMDCLKMYNNDQGSSVRLDPFQQIDDFKKYRSTVDWNNYSSFNGNTYALPAIIIEFMNPVPISTTGGNSTYTYPIVLESVFWLELLLNKPTPLFPTPSPCDLNYPFIAQVLSRACEGEFPVVVSFNSFGNFIKSAGRFAVAAGRSLAQTSIIPMAINAASSRYLGGPIMSNQPLIKRQNKGQATNPMAIKQRPLPSLTSKKRKVKAKKRKGGKGGR